MHLYFRFAVVIMLLLLISGCAYSLRSAKPPTNPLGVIPLGTQTRHLKIGDEWTYLQKSRMVASFMGDPIQSMRSTTRRVINLKLQGVPALVIAEGPTYGYAHFRGLNQGNFALLYIRQDPLTGAISEAADTGLVLPSSREQLTKDDPQWKTDLPEQLAPPRLAYSPAIIIPGKWSSSTSNAYHIDFNTSDTEDGTLQVVGTEQIETHAGIFNTWKVQCTRQFGDSRTPPTPSLPGQTPTPAMTMTTTSTEWWAPQLGSPVKEEILVHMGIVGMDMTTTMTDTLDSTNVPLK